MAQGRLIGDAYIVIYPDTDAFGPQLDAAIKAYTSGLKPTVNVRPTLDKAAAAAARAEAKAALSDFNVGVHLNPEEIATAAAALQEKLANLRADVNDTAALAKITAMQAGANALEAALEKAAKSENDVDFTPMEATLFRLQQGFEKLNSERVDLNTALADSQLTDLAARTGALHAQLMSLRATVDDTAAEAKIAALQAQAVALARSLALAPAGADLAPYEAKLLGIAAGFEAITAAEEASNAETSESIGLFKTFGLQGPGSLIHITDILNASIPGMRLYRGAIGDIYTAVAGADKVLPVFAQHLLTVASSGHLTAEAAIEFTAVWVPALISLAAYAAAATPTVIELYKQLQNMNTAATGTGHAFQSLATSGQSVVQAVQPTVLEAFGIGLFALQNHASNLANAMHTLGQGIDQLAAKAAIAFDSTAGSKFFTQGSEDALALMNSFQQLGSIIGTLLKVVPGYAEQLLSFGNALLTIAADAVKVAEPILQIGVALHGALFYGGLAGTAIAFAFAKVTAAVTTAIEVVASWAAANLAADSVVVEGLGSVLLTLDALGGPLVLGSIALLTGAFVGFTMYMRASKDAATDFNSQLEKTVQAASVMNLQGTLAVALAQSNVKVAQSYQQVTQAQNAASSSAGSVQFRYSGVTMAAQAAMTANGEYVAGQQQLSAQSQHLNLNLEAIATQFGVSIPEALSLANASQVTSNQLLSSGASNWAVISTMISGYIAQLKVIVPGTGALNQALNALNVTQSQQVQDAQKVAQAYSSWIGIVTGGDSAFTTFEQGQQTLASALNSSAGASVAFTDKLGNLEVKGTTAGASMNGLSAASLNARQAFDSQISAGTTLYGNLQNLSVVSGSTATSQHELYQAGKDVIAQLLPLAAGSKEATAEVGTLAQIVGFSGVPNFQNLSKWLGNTKGAEADLNTQQALLTESSANLTQAAKNLSAAMANEVAAGEAAAISQGTKLNSLQQQLVTSVENSGGAFTQTATTLAGQYYEALIKAGTGATTAQGDVDAFLTKLGATPAVVAQVNAALAKLPTHVDIAINVAENISMTAGATAAQNAAAALLSPLGHGQAGGVVGVSIPHMASGGYTVRGSGSSGQDSTLIMAAPGELVIPASHAPKFADMARKASIPGFDSGGIPGSVLGGGWAGLPYSFAPMPTYSANPVTAGLGLPGITSYQAATMIGLMQEQNKLLAQMPWAYAQALSQANSSGVRRGYFATAG